MRAMMNKNFGTIELALVAILGAKSLVVTVCRGMLPFQYHALGSKLAI